MPEAQQEKLFEYTSMKKSGSQREARFFSSREFGASAMIDARIQKLGDWRGVDAFRLRALIMQADGRHVEECAEETFCPPGTGSHGGMICTGETYKSEGEVDICPGRLSEDLPLASSIPVSTVQLGAPATSAKAAKANEKALKALDSRCRGFEHVQGLRG